MMLICNCVTKMGGMHFIRLQGLLYDSAFTDECTLQEFMRKVEMLNDYHLTSYCLWN